MESVGATGGGKGDKGGIDFSLANLCRCMCFTHEDKDASDSKVFNVTQIGLLLITYNVIVDEISY